MHCSLAHFGKISAGSLDPAQDRSCRHSGSSRRAQGPILHNIWGCNPWYNPRQSERCQSGRSGRSRKPLWSLRATVGSNPTLSARDDPPRTECPAGKSGVNLDKPRNTCCGTGFLTRIYTPILGRIDQPVLPGQAPRGGTGARSDRLASTPGTGSVGRDWHLIGQIREMRDKL